MKVSTAYNINLAIPNPTPEDDLSSSESTRSSGSRTESGQHTLANYTEVSSAYVSTKTEMSSIAMSGSGGRTNDASSFAISNFMLSTACTKLSCLAVNSFVKPIFDTLSNANHNKIKIKIIGNIYFFIFYCFSFF